MKELVTQEENAELKVRKAQTRLKKRELEQSNDQAHLATVTRVIEQILTNPASAGLMALAVNQALYRWGLYDPRQLVMPDGSKCINVNHFELASFDQTGFHFAQTVSQQYYGTEAMLESERIASGNASTIGIAIMVAMSSGAISSLSQLLGQGVKQTGALMSGATAMAGALK